MTGFDLAFLGVLGLSALAGAVKGLIRVLVSVASWAFALFITWMMGGRLVEPLTPVLLGLNIPESWHIALVHGFLFFLILLLGFLLGNMLRTVVYAAGLKPVDQVLGFCFGLVRGFLMMFVLTWVLLMMGLGQAPWWRNALFSPLLMAAVDMAKPYFPPLMVERLN